MSTPTPSRLTRELRAVFEQLADVLVPAHGKMPAASAVGTHEGLLDDVLKHRPDIRDDLLRALTAAQGREPRAAANDLLRQDAAAFDALGLAVSGAYYMSPRVRELLGYPGQESVVLRSLRDAQLSHGRHARTRGGARPDLSADAPLILPRCHHARHRRLFNPHCQQESSDTKPSTAGLEAPPCQGPDPHPVRHTFACRAAPATVMLT